MKCHIWTSGLCMSWAAAVHAFASQQPLLDESWSIDAVGHRLAEALDTMQSGYFEAWLGQWTTTIDWTGAVIGAHIAASANALRRHRSPLDTVNDTVDYYFTQLVAYYFGENAFAIRMQAHDDMLWVVLGWLESIKLATQQDSMYRTDGRQWHGAQMVPAFSHRAHVFYDMVSGAWDRSLCGGGLWWDPSLEPYKNTITNTQLVSAAMGMYLFHPGDDNDAPFQATEGDAPHLPIAKEHDSAYLQLAIEAYDWLVDVDLKNDNGLLVDGYHMSSYLDPHGHHVYRGCDSRDEMVYTYNQGVVLSGLRQLWEATGNTTYLQHGHKLVRDIVRASGWLVDSLKASEARAWHGLGTGGIVADYCDPRGTCNQDGQTFKGILFHHLAEFCEPLPTQDPLVPNLTHVANEPLAAHHAQQCRRLLPWVRRNAHAAWQTRDPKGIMGMWWGGCGHLEPALPRGATDWRNKRVDQANQTGPKYDCNDRGRGRTVESHSGGVAALRALLLFEMHYGQDMDG